MRILFVKAVAFAVTLAAGFAGLADAHGAGAREHSRTVSATTGHTSPPIIKPPGDMHHHRHHRRFVFIDQRYEEWPVTYRCVVRRIGADGHAVRVVIRRTQPCQAATPAASVHGVIAY